MRDDLERARMKRKLSNDAPRPSLEDHYQAAMPPKKDSPQPFLRDLLVPLGLAAAAGFLAALVWRAAPRYERTEFDTHTYSNNSRVAYETNSVQRDPEHGYILSEPSSIDEAFEYPGNMFLIWKKTGNTWDARCYSGYTPMDTELQAHLDTILNGGKSADTKEYLLLRTYHQLRLTPEQDTQVVRHIEQLLDGVSTTEAIYVYDKMFHQGSGLHLRNKFNPDILSKFGKNAQESYLQEVQKRKTANPEARSDERFLKEIAEFTRS